MAGWMVVFRVGTVPTYPPAEPVAQPSPVGDWLACVACCIRPSVLARLVPVRS